MTADRPRASPGEFRNLRVALAHDWLTGMRGGERVLEAVCELFPDAPLYTLIHVPGSVSPLIERRRIVTSFVQRLPNPRRFYRHYLPLYPLAIELFDFRGYDLVISSSHCAVKSVVTKGPTVHVCYCHSPMRYAWDQFGAYFGPEQIGPAASRVMWPVMRQLARWDAATAGRVDRFLANSRYVAGRIRRYYNRGSTIVYPPVNTDFHTPDGRSGSPGFLIVSALVPYKRIDVAIEACRRVNVPLRIVGTGPERARLEALAGPDVQFLGWQSDEQIRQLYRESSATLLPGVEDFGIVPVEAQACGCPVIAFDEGGATETVIDGTTGILVKEPTADAFADALAAALRTSFDVDALRANALRFSRQEFRSNFTTALTAAVAHGSTRGRDAARPPEPPEGVNVVDAARRSRAVQEAARDVDAARWPPGVQEAASDVDDARRSRAVQEAAPDVDAARWPPGIQEAVREDNK